MPLDDHNLSLDVLANDPALIASLDPEARSAVVMRCASILAAVSAAPAGGRHPDAQPAGGDLMTVAEAAARLKFARGYMYELIRNKTIPAIRHGRHFRIRASDVEKFIRENDTVHGIENRINGSSARHLRQR